MLFDQIKAIIETSNDGCSACFHVTEEMVEAIFHTGVQHGLFVSENFGIHDRTNSVYLLIGTLFDTKNISLGNVSKAKSRTQQNTEVAVE